jgi:hypothetical protein
VVADDLHALIGKAVAQVHALVGRTGKIAEAQPRSRRSTRSLPRKRMDWR